MRDRSLALSFAALAAVAHADRPLQVVFSAECNSLFDWHTAAIGFSFEVSGFDKVANLTRLLACSDEEQKTYPAVNLALLPTYVHRNLRDDPLVDEKGYPSYNKPYSVMAWLETRPPLPDGVDEFVLMTDADMVFREPIDPRAYGAARGVVISAEYTYLVGTENGFARRFIAEDLVPKLAQVGGFHIFHTEDLRKIAPLWLKYTKQVRAFADKEPETFYKESMSALEPGEEGLKAVRMKQSRWHSEMYGYVFAAAAVGVTHHTRRDVMLYPGYKPWLARAPKILHYGSDYTVSHQDGGTGSVYFNKMAQTTLKIETCPGFLFGAFAVHSWSGVSKRDALAIEHLAYLDGALCKYYKALSCPPADSLRFCAEGGAKLAVEIVRGAHTVFDTCADEHKDCGLWTKEGECEKNPLFMHSSCPRACGSCGVSIEDLFPEAVHLGDWKWKAAQAEKQAKREVVASEGAAAPDAKALAGGRASEGVESASELSVSAGDAGDQAAAEALLESGATAEHKEPQPSLSPTPTAAAKEAVDLAGDMARPSEKVEGPGRDHGVHGRRKGTEERGDAVLAQREAARAKSSASLGARAARSAEAEGGGSMATRVALVGVVVGALLLLRRMGLLGKRRTKKMYEDKCAV